MKALVKALAQPGLSIENVPEPQIGINDVKIRVLATGICGTDLHIYEWDRWAQKTIPVPLVIGHWREQNIAQMEALASVRAAPRQSSTPEFSPTRKLPKKGCPTQTKCSSYTPIGRRSCTSIATCAICADFFINARTNR